MLFYYILQLQTILSNVIHGIVLPCQRLHGHAFHPPQTFLIGNPKDRTRFIWHMNILFMDSKKFVIHLQVETNNRTIDVTQHMISVAALTHKNILFRTTRTREFGCSHSEGRSSIYSTQLVLCKTRG